MRVNQGNRAAGAREERRKRSKARDRDVGHHAVRPLVTGHGPVWLPDVRVLRRPWLQIFVGGLVLLYLLERTLLATQSLNYVPSVLLLGAFLVPVTFVTYLYERLPQWEVPLPLWPFASLGVVRSAQWSQGA